jgi:hypothetical protein
MNRKTGNVGILGVIALSLLAPEARSMQGPVPIRTLDELVTLSSSQLDELYRSGQPGPMPQGKVRGRALYPEARFPKARSNAARLAWQGKVFDPETSTAINKFFGVKAIKGKVYTAESWLDGAPSMILDYEGTSRIYGNYRDEIRQVAPGIYLGLMYDRTTSPVSLKMYFAFDDQP